ncbi:MAG: MFS transporter [Candidatus Tectimicrobiota bacterium]
MRALSDTTPASVEPRRFFGALHNRNFRYLWFAFTAASLAQRMDGIILGWLVLELTDSAFMVGLVGSMRFLGAMLGPLTGVIADRCDRRRLQMTSLLAMTGIVALLLSLALMRRLDVWSLFLATTLWGMVWAIHQPAQQSMQADILSGRELVGGIAMMNTAMNLTSMLGPALGGAILECCGPRSQTWEWSEEAMVLALNTEGYQPGRMYIASDSGQVAASTNQGLSWFPVAFLLPEPVLRTLKAAGAAEGVQWSYAVLLLLQLVQLGNYCAIRFVQRPPHLTQTSLWQNLLAGMRYSCSDPGLWTALALAGLVNLVAFPLQFGLLPVFARDVFSVGAAGLGLLGAALGAGSLLGSILMAYIGSVSRAGRLMLLGTLGWFALLIVFALTPDYELALGVLVLMGIAQTFSLANMTVLLLGTASSDMRGRVMGLRSLAVAPLFLGGTLAGATTASVGAPLTTIGCAVIGLALTLWVAPWVPRRVNA